MSLEFAGLFDKRGLFKLYGSDKLLWLRYLTDQQLAEMIHNSLVVLSVNGLECCNDFITEITKLESVGNIGSLNYLGSLNEMDKLLLAASSRSIRPRYNKHIVEEIRFARSYKLVVALDTVDTSLLEEATISARRRNSQVGQLKLSLDIVNLVHLSAFLKSFLLILHKFLNTVSSSLDLRGSICVNSSELSKLTNVSVQLRNGLKKQRGQTNL